ELSADLRRDANRPNHAEVDDDRRERSRVCGIAVLLRIETLAAAEREPQPEVRGLDVAMDEARAVERREAGARLEHDLPQLEERHEARHRVLAQVGANQIFEHEERNGSLNDAAIDDVRDVRVIEARERFGFLDERGEDAFALEIVGLSERVGLWNLENEQAI